MVSARRILPVLNALPVFEEASRSCSFTRAAETLGLAQPSVNRYTIKLEDHLGIVLFDRQNNKVLLTPDGEQFFEAVKLGLGHIHMSIEKIDTAVKANILTILCSQGFAHQWFLPRRASLMAYLESYEIHHMFPHGLHRFCNGFSGYVNSITQVSRKLVAKQVRLSAPAQHE